MNYIRHLNAFFSFVKQDNRLTASHVSLYLALFQYWNFNRFQNPFPVYRENIMQLSKIGSKNTYHKCIRELHQCKYIFCHPATQKYQPVKISMFPLDKLVTQDPDQIDLFSPKIDTQPGTNIGTGPVPVLTDTSPNIDTGTVPKTGQYIKPNNKQERETPTHQIFNKNKKIQDAINNFAAGGHFPSHKGEGGRHRRTDEADFAAGGPKSGHMPALAEVEKFFIDSNFPVDEAKKFYNHYKAIGWKIQGITPIEDWKALVEKWMTNTSKWNPPTKASLSLSGRDLERGLDLQSLYQSFLAGKKIFHQITPDHFDQLKLQLNEETIQQAWKERINQVSGTNQHSLDQLWQAYLTGDPNNKLVLSDRPNLESIAKRFAVLKYFRENHL